MKMKLNFWERLMGRRTKEVLKKDEKGVVSGKTIYHFDKNGGVFDKNRGVIEQIDAAFDEVNGRFVKQKVKTYSRRTDGGYDPDKTRYFDSQERETTCRSYNRDHMGMLRCEETKFVYTPMGKQVGSWLETSYDGGLWTKQFKEESIFDSFGRVIQNKQYKNNGKKLVCVKDKTYVRNTGGTYDPEETKYYDLEERLTKHKTYHREKTELGNILFSDEEKFTYDEKGQHVEKTSWFLMGSIWVPKGSFQSMVDATKGSKTPEVGKQEAKEKPMVPQLLKQAAKRDPRG